MFSKIKNLNIEIIMYLSWIVALAGIVMSLIYSEVLQIPICPLCWYQRILWYPLGIIYLVGILAKDKKVFMYALPFVFIGIIVASYQVLLQSGILPKVLETCGIRTTFDYVSCHDVNFRLFGLFTIPQQSVAGFLTLGLLGVWGNKR